MKTSRTKIAFTQKETESLTVHCREAAVALSRIFDVLREIGSRIGADWEPEEDGYSASEIIDMLSAEGDTVGITAARVTAIFSDPKNWAEGG